MRPQSLDTRDKKPSFHPAGFLAWQSGVAKQTGRFAVPMEMTIQNIRWRIARRENQVSARHCPALRQTAVRVSAKESCCPDFAMEGANLYRSKKKTPNPGHFPKRPSTRDFRCWQPYGWARYPAAIPCRVFPIHLRKLQNPFQFLNPDQGDSDW